MPAYYLRPGLRSLHASIFLGGEGRASGAIKKKTTKEKIYFSYTKLACMRPVKPAGNILFIFFLSSANFVACIPAVKKKDIKKNKIKLLIMFHLSKI